MSPTLRQIAADVARDRNYSGVLVVGIKDDRLHLGSTGLTAEEAIQALAVAAEYAAKFKDVAP